jgi:rhodanese-related sulfurtransferase
MQTELIDPRQAHDDEQDGALLVCAYDDDLKFEQHRLEGAISLSEFREREHAIDKGREIIFYCA